MVKVGVSETMYADMEYHLNRHARDGWELAFPVVPGALFLKRETVAETPADGTGEAAVTDWIRVRDITRSGLSTDEAIATAAAVLDELGRWLSESVPGTESSVYVLRFDRRGEPLVRLPERGAA